MRKISWAVAVRLVAVLVLGGPTAATNALASEGGRLDKMRQEAQRSRSKPRKPTKPSRPAPRHDRDDDRDDDEEFDPVAEILGPVFVEALLATLCAPFTIPRVAMRDVGWAPGEFSAYPYSDGDGYMLVGAGPSGLAPLGQGRPLACRGEFAYSRDDDIETFRGEFLLRTRSRPAFRASYTELVEDLSEGGTDTLSLADGAGLIRFAQHERGQMRAGIGYVSMAGEDEDGGFFVYEGDFFPCKPFVVSAGIDLGRIGEASFTRLRLSLGAVARNVEYAVGYSSVSVGSVEVEGLMAGLRVWF